MTRKYASPKPSAVNGTEESLTTMAGGAQSWNWQPLNSSSIGGTSKIRSGSAQNWNWVAFQQYLGRYRKPISIAGSTSALTDYQVNVTIINETGKMNANYTDLRFTASDGATLLPYWCENCTITTNATFWVKVPSIPTTGTTIYAYYGNPAANDAQNATGTFEAFGGFTTWTETDPTSVLDVTASRVTYTSVAANIAKTMVSTPVTYPGNFIIEWEELYGVTTDNYPPSVGVEDNINGRWGYSVAEGVTSIMAVKDNTQVRAVKHSNGAQVDTSGFTSVGSVAANILYYLRLQRAGSTVTLGIFTNPARTTHIPGSPVSFTESAIAAYNFVVAAANSGSNALVGSGYQQNLKSRKYASPEPSAVNGTEEDSPIPQNITVPMGGATNWTWYPS